MTLKRIVNELSRRGVIPEDMESVAVAELRRELTRRTQRLSYQLAVITEQKQRAQHSGIGIHNLAYQ